MLAYCQYSFVIQLTRSLVMKMKTFLAITFHKFITETLFIHSPKALYRFCFF